MSSVFLMSDDGVGDVDRTGAIVTRCCCRGDVNDVRDVLAGA